MSTKPPGIYCFIDEVKIGLTGEKNKRRRDEPEERVSTLLWCLLRCPGRVPALTYPPFRLQWIIEAESAID